MKKLMIISAFAATLPFAASALPEVGAVVGTNPTEATAALTEAGCKVAKFEAEEGMIEAVCYEVASGKKWDIFINPQTGVIADIRDKE